MMRLLRYLIPLFTLAAATGLNMLLWDDIKHQVDAFFFLAVMLSAWFGGVGPGLLATVMAVAVSIIFFVEPRYSLNVGFVDLLRLLIFLAVAIIINWLNVARENAQNLMRSAYAQLENRVLERTTELTRVNGELRQEVESRQRAEKELLEYQERLRELSSELSIAEQRERQRLASQLHDSVGQMLALAQMKLEPLSASAGTSADALALRQTCDLLSQAIDETRSLTWELSPPVLNVMGFAAALEWLVEQAQKRYGISLGLNCQQGLNLADNELKLFLFSAVRELVINCAKHAGSTVGMVYVVCENGELRVTVEDSGKGFDATEAVRRQNGKHSFGLFSVRERLRHFGGRIDIDSAPGKGARVSIIVPLPSAVATERSSA